MAKNVNGGKIEYSVGLKIDESGFKQLKAELQEIQKMKVSQAEGLGVSKSELTQIKSRAREVEVALSAAFNPKLNTTNIDTFNKKLEGSNLTLKQVYADWSRLGTTGTNAFRSLANELTKSNYELKQSNTLLDKMATTLANTIKWNIASNAINSMTRSIEQAWGYAKSLDGSLNDIRIVTGKSADEMARFAVVANDTAKSLGKSTTDYTKASLIYAQQGLPDKEVQERARITLMAANVTGQSSDEVSEQLTSVWNGYKVTADEAEIYVDRLAKIAANTASNLEELSTGMSKVASAANAMGVSEGQLAAQISTIISATRQAPESVGTALRTVYARISDIKAGVDEEGVSLGNYSQKMADLGINVLDVNGKLRDMGSVMEEIGGKWADMTREQQVSLAQTMAGQRQYSNLVALFDNFDNYQKALDYANEAEGTLQEQQNIYMEGLNAHLQVLSTSLDDIYDSLLDIGTTDSIKNLVDLLAKGATAAATLIDNLGGGKQILGMLASVAPLLFTTQITKGIQSQVYNRGVAKQKEESFANSMRAISEIQGIEDLDEDTRRLMNDKEKMYRFADIMPKEQLESLTQAEDKIKDLTNQVEKYNDEVEEGQKRWEAFLGLYGNEEEFKKFANEKIVNVKPEELDEAVKEYSTRLQKEQKNIEDQLLPDEGAMYRGIAEGLRKRRQKLEEATDKVGDFSKTDIKDRIASGKYNPKIDATFEKILSQTDEGKDFWDKLVEETKSKNHGKSDWQKRQTEALEKIEELYLKANGIDAKSIEEYYAKQEDKLERSHQERLERLERRRNEINEILAGFESGTSAYDDIEKSEIDEASQELDKALAERESLIESIKKSFEDIDFSTAIQDVTQFAGGVGSIYIGLSQIKSLGSIWTDNDSSTWEKITQSASVLAISLPLIVTGLKTLRTAAPAVIAHFKTLNTAFTNAWSNLGGIKGAATNAGAGLKALKAALSTTAGAFYLVAGAATVAIAAFAIYGAAVDKMRQQTIEASEAQIEENKEKIKEVETNAEIYRSLGQLNQQRENGTITLSQMKDGIADLVDKYGEEKISLEELNKVLLKNKDIRGYVLDKEIENAEEIKRLTEENKKNAEIAAIETSKGSFFSNFATGAADFLTSFNTIGTGLEKFSHRKQQKAFAYSGADRADEFGLDEYLKKNFETTNAIAEYGMNIYFEKTSEGIQKYYDKLIEIRKAYEDWSPEQRAAAELDDWVEAEIAKYESYVEEIRNDNEEIEKQSLITAGKEIEKSGVANFGSINDLESYLENRNQLIQSYREAGYTAAYKAANDYLELEHKELSDEYALYATYADNIAAEFDLEDSAEIANTISQLDLDQLRYLSTYFDLDESNIQDWETLKKIIEEVLNLSSKKDLMEEASEQYDKYSTLRDQINSSKKKTISKKEFEGLDASVQGLFTHQANGQYKMTATQEQFNRIVDNLSLAGFENNREIASERIRNLENYRNKMPDIQSVSSAVDSKLNYLDIIGYDAEQVSAWKMANSLEGVGLDDTQLQAIHDAYLENLSDSSKLDEELEKQIQLFKEADLAIARSAETYKDLDKMYEDGEISLESYNNAWLELDQSLDTSTLDYNELKEYSEYLQEAADNVDNLDDGLKDNEKAAEIVAKGIMKMNDAVETLANNWENWSDILKNSNEDSEEYSKALKNTKTAVAQLLDISETRVSDDFLVKPETLDLITQAATGSETAIDSLKDALHQSIVEDLALELEVNKDAFLQSVADLESQIPNLKTTVEVGTELSAINEEAFIESANKLIEDSKMTVEQAQAYFDSLGYEPTFVTEDQVITSQKPTIRTSTRDLGTHWVDTGIDHNGQKTGYMATEKEEYSYISGYTPVEEHVLVPALSTKGTPQIKSLTKKATGASNNFSSTNAGGGAPGKSSGKSGSGSSSKPSQKDKEKPIEDDRDIYHDINIEIEQAKRNLERVQKIQERLFGKDLINNLNKQIALIDKQKEKLLEKQKIQEWDLANQQKALGLLGVTFDEYNNIANYMQILAEGQQKVNDATAEYNNLVDAYNAKGTKDEQEGLEESLDAAKEKLKNAEDAYKKLEDKIKNYDQLTVDMADLVDELTEATQQQIEIKITKFRMNVQIRLDMGEAQRDWNNFKRNVLYKTDILKDTNFDKIFKDAIKDLEDAISYFNVNGSVGSLQTLTDQIVRTRKEIEDIDKTGTSAIYGDNKAKAMEDLQNDLKELMSQMENIEELINSIDQAYLDTMEDISDQFNKQIEDYEFINELLQHDMNLLTLLYGEKNFNAMNNYYTQLEANNLKQLDSLKQQAEFWKERWLAAGDDIQAAAMFEEKYKETIKNLNSLIEESAKTLQDKYTNAITGIFDALDKKISDGKGTDYLSTEWDLINKHADEYLDTINTAFAIQETESKYNKAINDTQSVKNQQALKKLQNEQLEILKNKEKVTQYDVDRAEKLLQIEQARIALEEAQNAKTSMRLKRDSQGNYSYEYVADDNDIAEAQDALNSAMNDLYNFDKAAYKANLNELLGAWKEFETELAAVLTDSALSEEERTEKVALLKQRYGERINFLTEDNLHIRQNLTESAFADLAQLYDKDVESYENMADTEKTAFLESIIPIWESGIGAMADKITQEGGFEATCKDAFEEIENAASEYSDSLKTMAEAAGANFDNVKQGIDPLATELEKLITPTNELMNKVGEQEGKIKSLRLEVEGLRDDWGEVYEAAKKAVSETNEYILEQQKQAAQEAQAAQSGTENNSGAGSANGAGTSSGTGSTGSGTPGVGTGSGAGVSAVAASAELIDGIVGNIMQGENTWGWGDERIANITSKFGREVAEAVQGKINREWPNVSLLHGYDPEFYKRYSMSNFRSGGYTGDWSGREGRLALLHQKELVLNQQDTSNLLDVVETLRTVMSSMNGTFAARANDIRNGLGNLFTNNEAIEQNVHIDASFPNVNSKKEIEEAFAELVNLAAQRVMKN